MYFRSGVPTLTPTTLKSYLLEEIPIQVYAAPGGFYVRIDGQRLREERERRNLSRGDLARMLHVSRRAIKMYEEGMDARVEVAALMEEFLHPDVIKSFDLLKPVKHVRPKPNISETDWLYTFQKEIFSMVEKIGYKVIPLRRCPFEAVSRDRRHILLTSARKFDASLKERARVVGSIARITEKHAVIFTDRREGKRSIEGTPMIGRKELARIRDPYEIMNMIIEREK
ncbi:MAG TPA: helix-turn-helix domain-containing protein [Thermoplasmatales archaeon]|nr:helix-turn-helix domain-containing protein [Thermoplasmatales archaeon]